MHRSFQEVIRSGINNSKSKQSHAFPHAPRFNDNFATPCQQASYNLNSLMMSSSIKKRDRCTSQSARTFIVRDYSPGPFAYDSKSFLDKKKSKVGPTIAQAERLNERSKEVVPGPGTYSPKEIKQKKLSYTMSPRLESPLSKPFVGPGQYQTEKYNTIEGTFSNKVYSKYAKVQSYKIGKEERFHTPTKNTPGPTEYGKSRNQMKQTYSFGREQRTFLASSKAAFPGPGAYHQFSEFAERRRQLQSNLRKMEKLVKQR